jgi:hypothetical protein
MRAWFLLLTAAAVSVSANAQAADKKKDSGSRMICRSSEVTGSRVLGSQICKTKAEWEADKMRIEHEALELQQRGIRQDPVSDRPAPQPRV